MEELLRFASSPFGSIAGIAIGVAGVIFAVFAWLNSNKKKCLSFCSSSNWIVRSGQNVMEDLIFRYKDEPVQSLCVTRVAIWNSGKGVIDKHDIASTCPLRIFSDSENYAILDVSIVEHGDKSINLSIKEFDRQQAIVDFEYLSHNDGFAIQIIHTGAPTEIQVEGKIKGGEKIKNRNGRKLKISRSIMRKILLIESVLMISISIAGLIYSLLLMAGVIVPTNTSSEDKYYTLLICCIALTGISALFAKMIAKNYFSPGIPSNLKEVASNEWSL